MVGKRVVCSHRPGIRGDRVHLNVKIGADRAACDAVDFAIQVNRSMEISRDSIRRKASVIGITDWIVAPKRGSGVEVLVHAAKQVNVRAITDRGQPVASGRQGSNRAPAIGRRSVLVSVCNSDIVGDAAETIDVAAL